MGCPSQSSPSSRSRRTGTNSDGFTASRNGKKTLGLAPQLYLASSEEVREEALENLLNKGENLFAVLPKSPNRFLDKDFESLLLKKRKELST